MYHKQWIYVYYCFSFFVTNSYEDQEISEENSSNIDEMKYLSSSTEDLIYLFNSEKETAIYLSQLQPLSREVRKFLNQIDYDIHNGSSEYVHHPINVFHMLKRLSHIPPNLQKIIPKTIFNYNYTTLLNDYVRALHGLADLHEYNDVNILQIAKGIIKDETTGKVYSSKSGLNSSDLLKVAQEAKNVNYLDGFVDWLRAALQVAKDEKRTSKHISGIKKAIKKGKEYHDTRFKSFDWNKAILKTPPITKEHLYFNDDADGPDYEKNRAYHAEPFYSDENYLRTVDERWHNSDLQNRMNLFLRPRVRKLCNGKHQKNPTMEMKLKCILLHHKNPYLKLGPFKLDLKHQNPEIALFHDFGSPKETNQMIDLVKGNMKSTPYDQHGELVDFTKDRTSKMKWINESLVPEAMPMVFSKRIELAMKLNLRSEPWASENFQIMNYGIGGKISGHVDEGGYDAYEFRMNKGGPRIPTFMIYLSSVEVGGHTVFPQPGISVKPVKGSALFWWNMGPQDNYDSRICHLGCPVLYGNKWIANKWVKLLANFKTAPCSLEDMHYSILK